MENANQPPNRDIFSGQKTMLPNATAVLVLGICSIVFSCFYVGLILGIIGLVLSGKGRKMYKDAPALYDGYSQLNAGFIMSIIGTALGAIWVIYVIIWVVILGTASASFWQQTH